MQERELLVSYSSMILFYLYNKIDIFRMEKFFLKMIRMKRKSLQQKK